MVRAFARLHAAAGSAIIVIVIVIATAWLAIFGVEHVYHPRRKALYLSDDGRADTACPSRPRFSRPTDRSS